MSYYSSVSLDLIIRPDRLKKFKSQLEDLVKTIEDDRQKAEEWVFYNLRGLSVDGDGELDYEDYHGKHYDTDKFAWWLKDFATEGRLQYRGEDDDQWGYEFDGGDRIYHLEFLERRGEELLLTREGPDGKRDA